MSQSPPPFGSTRSALRTPITLEHVHAEAKAGHEAAVSALEEASSASRCAHRTELALYELMSRSGSPRSVLPPMRPPLQTLRGISSDDEGQSIHMNVPAVVDDALDHRDLVAMRKGRERFWKVVLGIVTSVLSVGAWEVLKALAAHH